ncbi:Innexin inx2 [Araneus ventricosus]|uniref:Innexin n=1 Tax=Araneus ventricosus TaxID=182803 RepID=A0A4Y2BKB8_ARAVE|nr:Innexin inx2 [Araneus ventricosus]
MLDIFSDFDEYIEVDYTYNDNNVFRLHYKATVIILLGFTVLLGCSQYFGDPINCIHGEDVPENVLETYCWIHSTFTLPDAYDKRVGIDVAHPGIDKHNPGETKRYHAYYQWVIFLLFFQALLFYVPRYIWETVDDEKIKNLCMDVGCGVLQQDDRAECRMILVDYLKSHIGDHNVYLLIFTLLEMYNLLNVLGQLYIMDLLFGREFTSFGIDVLKFTNMDQENRTDPMIKVFPRMTKCTFHTFGFSGDVQKHDALCILPINVLNEKLYVFIWFWFVVLAALSVGMLVFRFVTILWPAARSFVLMQKCDILDKNDLQVVMKHIKVGDWFVLHLLTKNVDFFYFKEVIHDFANELKEDAKLNRKGSLEDYKALP